MTQKEKRQEQTELEQVVATMCASIRYMAHRKARQYEVGFLCRVRDILDKEIETKIDVRDLSDDIVTKNLAEAPKG